MKLYHGSNNNNVNFDKNAYFAVFGNALFTTSNESLASNYGQFIYSIEVEDDQILTQQDFWYNLDNETVINALSEVIEEECLNLDDIDQIYELSIDDENVNQDIELAQVLGCDEDVMSICWKAQKIRIAVAEKLGYKAVEMNDENGISYAVINPELKKEF